VISFRLFGRRIFRLAPFHHHLEMHDWPEFTIIVRLWIVAVFSRCSVRCLLRRLLEDRQRWCDRGDRQKDLRTDTRPARGPADATPGARTVPADARGVASGRVLLLITTLLVTFGTIAVASASEGQSAPANGGTTWSIMIHDLVYLGFGLFRASTSPHACA